MKDVAIIGKFFGGAAVSDGQSVKTKILTEELERIYGKQQITRIDTIGWKDHPVRLLWQSIKAVRKSRNVIFRTDENGTKIFPLLLRLANFDRKCKLHYYVIGGWLSHYLDRSGFAVCNLKKLCAIYVEVPAMLKELQERGFENAVLVNKFRRLNPIDVAELDMNPSPPYKMCFFSRVMREKGVEEAIQAVKEANERAGFIKYTLDIFGSIHSDYRNDFEKMVASFPEYIKYGGIVDFQKSADSLKQYFALLFPTFYTSEGYPNAVVDAYAAGLPIIATRWNYNADIIQDGKDGVLVDIKNVEQIVEAMECLADDREKYALMRRNCLERCTEYLPEKAIMKVVARMR